MRGNLFTLAGVTAAIHSAGKVLVQMRHANGHRTMYCRASDVRRRDTSGRGDGNRLCKPL